ncbi:12306_t:CDS:2 [Dentiscutata erythropus]|uniref:12306_t:CDS:1 n=1 Tax=Dentiscutata erythropus TaxID=1348616 RepID=A0A9N9F569_9GLOM|nr:12306_t:CDS:2 [Dentiscutata erythropus]
MQIDQRPTLQQIQFQVPNVKIYIHLCVRVWDSCGLPLKLQQCNWITVSSR